MTLLSPLLKGHKHNLVAKEKYIAHKCLPVKKPSFTKAIAQEQKWTVTMMAFPVKISGVDTNKPFSPF
jgi:hypothetical protein